MVCFCSIEKYWISPSNRGEQQESPATSLQHSVSATAGNALQNTNRSSGQDLAAWQFSADGKEGRGMCFYCSLPSGWLVPLSSASSSNHQTVEAEVLSPLEERRRSALARLKAPDPTVRFSCAPEILRYDLYEIIRNVPEALAFSRLFTDRALIFFKTA